MYTPPVASAAILSGIDFSRAVNIGGEDGGFIAQVKEMDEGAAKEDPSSIAALLRLPGGAVFWSAKLAVDADGIYGKHLDPEDGQNDTSFHFHDGSPLDSVRHPYYVEPLGIFGQITGLSMGDVCAVIYRNQITAAIFGDEGPHKKLGEASICVHDGLAPAAPDCCHRDAQGNPLRIIDVSIERNVLVMAFPNSRDWPQTLTPQNLPTMVRSKVYALFGALGGAFPAAGVRQ